MTSSLRIVVIGAGYAGLLATVRLAGKVKHDLQRGQVAITLVNAAEVFVERLRLHQLAANQPIVSRPIAPILKGTGVSFVRGVVTSVDAAQHRLQVQSDAGVEHIRYDYLVYALGSTIDRESVPGVREQAYVLTPSGPRSAAALREVLLNLNMQKSSGRLLVCGGGATGIEAAAEFAAAYPNMQVQLVTQDELGSFMKQKIADYMRQSLRRLGVEIREHCAIIEVKAQAALTVSGELLPYDVCLWAGGFTVPSLAREAGLAVNERSQILIDPFMRSISHPKIYAIGDAAYPLETPGVTVRMAAFTAAVMGAHGADCLSAVLQGKQPKPFSFAYAGQAIALGRHNAIGFNTYPNDQPNSPYFKGKTGYTIREFFVRLLAELPHIERRWPGFFTWLGKGRYAAAQRRERLVMSTSPQQRQPAAIHRPQD